MKEITLKQYLESGHKQWEVAELLGCNQSAVSQMLAKGRDIRLVLNKRGAVVSHYENKTIKGRRSK